MTDKLWSCGICHKTYAKFDGLHKHVNSKHPTITSRTPCIELVNAYVKLQMDIFKMHGNQL